MRTGWTLAVLLAFALHGPPASAGEPDPEAVRRAIREVLAEERLQKEFPAAEAPEPEPEPPPERRGGGSEGGSGGSEPTAWPRQESSFAGPLATVLEALLWTGLAIVVALGAVAVLRSVVAARRERSVAPVPSAPAPASPGPPPPDPLEHLDALAEGGRSAEAIHGLLLRAIGDLRRRGRTALPDELTSREILDRASLPTGPAASLGSLVGSVERVLFAGRPADRAAYDEARARYVEVRTACVGRGT